MESNMMQTLLMKSPSSLGVAPANDYQSTSKNIQILQQYSNAILNGDSYALTDGITPATQPFGNRQFLKTNTPCIRNDNNENTDRYILVDNMKYMKDENGNLDTNHYGLLYSAEGSLQDVDTNSIFSKSNMNYNPSAIENKCVPVSIYLDNSKTKTETKYVTINDCNKIDSVAFVNGTKNCPSIEQFSNNDQFIDENEKISPNIVIDDDLLTKYYIGSITFIGLFIFYKLYIKK